jgi:hypothetical protein
MHARARKATFVRGSNQERELQREGYAATRIGIGKQQRE